MVSPMREKRAWPPREKDADAEAVAAFEKTVAVVKETVVRSGEVLVSAKEDLSDHQRWIKAQSAQVQADRDRHDRWLQRQRELQEAHERREQKRARRREMRQAFVRSITGAIAAAVFAVRSAIWFVVAKIAAGLNAIDAAAAQGLRFIGAKLRDLALAVGGGVGHVVVLAVGTVRSLALSAWAFVVAGLASLGAWLKSGDSRLSARLHRVVPSVGHFLTVSFGEIGARVRDAWRTIGSALGVGLARLSARAGRVAHGIAEAGRPVLASVSAKAHALAPSLVDACGRAGHAAGNYAKAGALRLKSLLPAKAPPVGDENAVSSPRAGGFELSQMLIIAGTILLVCGGLMLGGGLLLRAGTPSSAVATASPAEPIAWLFEHKTLPIDERSVFAYTTTAEGVRIKGFAIGGVNLSDHSVSSLGGVIKPDHKPREIALTLSVEMPGEGAAQQAEVTGSIDDGTVPSQAPFRLVFLFPESGDGGMTPREVLDAYGGLMLKVRYDVNGTQRSFIQYLPQALLEEQLAEIAAEAKGS